MVWRRKCYRDINSDSASDGSGSSQGASIWQCTGQGVTQSQRQRMKELVQDPLAS